jgi:hypothetical protein
MLEGTNNHVAREAMVRTRPRERTAMYWRWLGMLTTAGVTTTFWVSILMLASHVLAFSVSARVTIGFGLAVAALSFVAAAIAMAGSLSEQGPHDGSPGCLAGTMVSSSSRTCRVRPPA